MLFFADKYVQRTCSALDALPLRGTSILLSTIRYFIPPGPRYFGMWCCYDLEGSNFCKV